MNYSSHIYHHLRWTLPQCSLMFVVGLAALLEYFTGSALLLGNNISVELLIATIFIASLMPSRTWLIHFTCATTLIAIALWLAKADDPMYSFEKGFLLLLAIWASAGLSLAIRKQQEPSQARAVLIDELGLISIVLDNNLTIIRCNGALDETLQVSTGTCVGNPFCHSFATKTESSWKNYFRNSIRAALAILKPNLNRRMKSPFRLKSLFQPQIDNSNCFAKTSQPYAMQSLLCATLKND